MPINDPRDSFSVHTIHRYLGSVIFAFKTNLTTTLNHILVLILLDKVLKKTLFAINALFTKDNNLSKTKVGDNRYMLEL